MYHFAIVALLGLAAYKSCELLGGFLKIEEGRMRTLLTLGVGVVFTELLDYSIFAGWGIGVRESWMGPVFTGLVVGAIGYAWDHALDIVAGFAGRRTDEGHRTPRAA
jgi:hypothetical protein